MSIYIVVVVADFDEDVMSAPARIGTTVEGGMCRVPGPSWIVGSASEEEKSIKDSRGIGSPGRTIDADIVVKIIESSTVFRKKYFKLSSAPHSHHYALTHINSHYF